MSSHVKRFLGPLAIAIIMTSQNPTIASTTVKLYPPPEPIQINTYHIPAPIHGYFTLSVLKKFAK